MHIIGTFIFILFPDFDEEAHIRSVVGRLLDIIEGAPIVDMGPAADVLEPEAVPSESSGSDSNEQEELEINSEEDPFWDDSLFRGLNGDADMVSSATSVELSDLSDLDELISEHYRTEGESVSENAALATEEVWNQPGPSNAVVCDPYSEEESSENKADEADMRGIAFVKKVEKMKAVDETENAEENGEKEIDENENVEDCGEKEAEIEEEDSFEVVGENGENEVDESENIEDCGGEEVEIEEDEEPGDMEKEMEEMEKDYDECWLFLE